MARKPQVGSSAPPFELQTTGGAMQSLADLTGRRVVLYFFPKASTPG